VEAVDAGLRERTLSGWSALPWSDVEAVEPSAGAIRLRGRKGQRVEVATRGFTAEDRTRLERTVARRIREAAP
jgi:predicted ATPase